MTYAFNLSQFANKVNTSGQADLTSAVTGVLPVANGGTNSSSLTGNTLMVANSGGTAISSLANGASGYVLTSTGTGTNAPTWQAPTVGGQNIQLFTSNTTWTPPSGITKCIVHAIGGGGGGNTSVTAVGNHGGYICAFVTGLSGSVNITIGAGGTDPTSPGTAGDGGDTTFGSYVTAGGGKGAYYSTINPTLSTATTASSGGVTVTKIQSITQSPFSTYYNASGTTYGYNEFNFLPYFGGKPSGWCPVYYAATTGTPTFAYANVFFPSSGLRTTWDNTNRIGAGSGGLANSLTGSRFGIAGAMAIIY